MTGDELGDAARTLFGDHAGATVTLAEVLTMRHDTLRRMVKGRQRIPPGIEAEVKKLLAAKAAVEKTIATEDNPDAG